MRKLIVMCSLVGALAVGAIAVAGDNDESPEEDESFECPAGTFPMEGSSHTCIKLAADECGEGWSDNGETCTCETGVTNADGSCNLEADPDLDDDGVAEPGESWWPFGNNWEEDAGIDCGPGHTGVSTYGDDFWYCRPDCPAGTYRADDPWDNWDSSEDPCISNECDLSFPPESPCLTQGPCGSRCGEDGGYPVDLSDTMCELLLGQDGCDAVNNIVLDDGHSIRYYGGIAEGYPTLLREIVYPRDSSLCPTRGQLRNSFDVCVPACQFDDEIPCVDQIKWVYDAYSDFHRGFVPEQ